MRELSHPFFSWLGFLPDLGLHDHHMTYKEMPTLYFFFSIPMEFNLHSQLSYIILRNINSIIALLYPWHHSLYKFINIKSFKLITLISISFQYFPQRNEIWLIVIYILTYCNIYCNIYICNNIYLTKMVESDH